MHKTFKLVLAVAFILENCMKILCEHSCFKFTGILSCMTPNSFTVSSKRLEVNCGPLSVLILGSVISFAKFLLASEFLSTLAASFDLQDSPK